MHGGGEYVVWLEHVSRNYEIIHQVYLLIPEGKEVVKVYLFFGIFS